MERLHRSVMVGEVLDILRINSESVLLDATFGEGGHTESFLHAGAQEVWGIDRDEETLKRYLKEGTARTDPRLHLVHGTFGEDTAALPDSLLFHGALVDLGVSTRQLLIAERGFSFAREGPVDMRMDNSQGETLLERLSQVKEEDLSYILFKYAEVPGARSLARRILERVHAGTLRSTLDLASLCGPKRTKTHPATTVFLALRMWVNDELGQIERGLPEIWKRIRPGGRLAVLTFHSVEDGMVKRMFRQWAGLCICRQTPCRCRLGNDAHLVSKKAILPTEDEIASNPRARSTQLRCVEKVADKP